MNKFEIQRQKYKPGKISILFIAESPPHKGTFFYFANSNLYAALLTAFRNVFPQINAADFLDVFRNKNCYLEDLCADPVNHLDEIPRLKARMDGIALLAEKLKQYKPDVTITIMKDICGYVNEAIKISGIQPTLRFETSFPVRSQTNIDKCIADIEKALHQCRSLGLIR